LVENGMLGAYFSSRIFYGAFKRPFRLAANIFIVYAATWGFLEPIISIVPHASEFLSGFFKYFILVLFSVIFGFLRSISPQEISVNYANCKIVISFGNLFSTKGFQSIPVSRYFYETEVFQNSLQGQLIAKFLQSSEGVKGLSNYRSNLEYSLDDVPFELKDQNSTEKGLERYYPLGTTVAVDLQGQQYFLFALTETESEGRIPNDNCDPTKLWIVLDMFWKQARILSRGKPINIPLIGSGVTGIRLSPKQLLELNLLAIASAIESGGKITTDKITIVLHPQYIGDINLQDISSMSM
jgi:Domain of unknown function (DUF6430)